MSGRVLLITFHFPPSAASGSFRMLGFAQHLPPLGWDISVLSCGRFPYEPVDLTLSDRIPPSVAVREVDYPQFIGWRLLLSRLCRNLDVWYEGKVWLREVWPVIKNMVRETAPDVVLTSGPPHLVHMLGFRVKRCTGATWVADFRDPWVAGAWKEPLPNIRERRAERVVVAKADLVIANAPLAQAAFCEHYPQWSRKFVTITNGYDPAPLQVPKRCGDGSIRIVHVGEIYVGRDPRPLLDAIALAQPGPTRLRVEFIGRVEGIDLEEEAQRRGLADVVRARGHVSSVQASRAIEEANISLLMDTPGRRVGVPAKLYEYIGSGRPILALAERDSDTAWALEQSGVSYALAPPRSVEAIASAISQAVACVNTQPAELPPQAARFTRASLASELSHQLGRLLLKNTEHSFRVRPTNVEADPQTLDDGSRGNGGHRNLRIEL